MNTAPIRIGDKLLGLNQGAHASLEHGTYRGNGEYKIYMKNGGHDPDFDMVFILSGGPNTFTLERQDTNDPATTLHDRGFDGRVRRLTGGDYSLAFE